MRWNRMSMMMAVAALATLMSFTAAAAADTAPSSSAAAPELPWFVMTGRLAFGGGAGSADFHWDLLDGMSDHDEEGVPLQGLSHMAIIPEAFFMPTKARGFIISASFLYGGGSGKMGQSEKLSTADFTEASISYSVGDRIFDGEDISYRYAYLNLGLGYQWYFGLQKRTNLFLMSHLGPGSAWFALDYQGETRNSKALGGWDFDISVGSWHRFPSQFVLGGSLDYWINKFSGQAGSTDLIDTYVSGGMGIMRLNLLAGYAFQ